MLAESARTRLPSTDRVSTDVGIGAAENRSARKPSKGDAGIVQRKVS